MSTNTPRHTPVMPEEVLRWLAVRPDGIYADLSCGLGGHSRLIAERLGPGGRLLALDRDAESLEIARANLADLADRVTFAKSNFSGLRATLDALGVDMVDGMLADCGVSLYQLTDPDRGFSIKHGGPLDLRMDRSQELTAAHVVNTWSEREIADIILQYGEERRWRRAAGAIVRGRPVHSVTRLAAILEPVLPRTSKLHPATLVFQALRVAVNGELDEIEALTRQIPACVRPGGRVVALTFQSGEDRIWKRAFQEMARSGRADTLTKHVERPSREETIRNPPSRSAKLRAAEIRQPGTS